MKTFLSIFAGLALVILALSYTLSRTGGMIESPTTSGSGAPRGPHIIIVGAGISGLTAGQELEKNGIRVTILEAKDVIGGRIQERTQSGIAWELGASWIHGDAGNPVAKILETGGAELVPTPFETRAVYKNGVKQLSDSWGDEDAFSDWLEEIKSEETKDISLEDAWKRWIKEEDTDISALEAKSLGQIIRQDISTENGADLENLSTLQYNEEGELAGGDKIVIGGYTKVINSLGEGLDIHLNSVVNSVKDLGGSVEVMTQSGVVWKGDAVIVTVPLGVLQRGSISFDPVFPDKKQIAVNTLQMGNLHKTFLLFERKFWDDADTITFLRGSEEKYIDFINGYNAFGKPILIALHAGEAGKKTQDMTVEEISDRVYETLRSAYSGATRPTLIVTSNWHKDPYTYGSYSYVPPGATLSMYDDIREPYGNIFFAGEHTSSLYPSTTHGAYISGIRAAEDIMKKYTEASKVE